jgi:predicted transcriptional regulator
MKHTTKYKVIGSSCYYLNRRSNNHPIIIDRSAIRIPVNAFVSDVIKACRSYSCLSQKALSKLSGVSLSTVFKVEQGLRMTPTFQVMHRLIVACGIDIIYLV